MSQEQSNAAPQPENSSLDEQLVAYLDGELSPEESRSIEALLASQPEVRRKLQGLERSWELLDQLAPTPIDEAFTRSTMEMVAIAAADEVALSQAALPRVRRRRWLLGACGTLVAAGLGFVTGILLWPDPNRHLLEDLPVLQHLDEYRQVQDFRLLKRLADEHLFDEERAEEGRP
jgi:ferric-dicitrate binding protein FerR (iron transport regulator)